ncbi:nucleotidyltransferase family protein [Marivirga atlantica]|uniref:Nucleotidyltransferase family protein n=1 Tax=Marivirga atlantica TaxID=1548457 RepID=A0A937ACI6_9BACT|nr:nucleotidyltransferase family protein [Marivirga atlantica]MBL0766451.1 nucleotidyltransferase family protein [Marivirga atlantica]
MKWLNISENNSFEKAVELLDHNGTGFLPVVDQHNKLIGVITDGDLRRAILAKKIADVKQIMNADPITMPSGTSHVIAKRKLKQIHRRQMPLVDEQGKLTEVVLLNDFDVAPKEEWVVIMAGGLGSRLGELTKDIPKPMLPIGGRPMLEHIIDNFKEFGFYKFILCVNYKAEIIENHFKDGTNFGIEVRYTHENKRMGTAGPLSLIDFDISDNLFVVNGDLITSIDFNDFLEFHLTQKADATMCVKSYSNEIPYACINADSDNNLLEIQEKPSFNYHINAGMYIVNKDLLKLIPNDTFYDMPTLFEEALGKGKSVKIFRMDDYWLDIGQPSDYQKGNNDLKIKG